MKMVYYLADLHQICGIMDILICSFIKSTLRSLTFGIRQKNVFLLLLSFRALRFRAITGDIEQNQCNLSSTLVLELRSCIP